jgi:hypothetical protein
VNFVLLLQATVNKLGVTTAHLQAIAQAVTVQANRDFAPTWGGQHLVRVATAPTDILPGEVAYGILDDLPSAPGAVAYHDVSGAGVPACFEAVNMCESILTGQDSIAQAISHEVLETLGDPGANRWADKGDGSGTQVALEMCDAVESAYYDVLGVSCSDFVLPAFFVGTAPGPYSFLGRSPGRGPTAPFQTTFGGYQILRAADGTVSSVSADKQRVHAAKRVHFSSRAAKRGLLP